MASIQFNPFTAIWENGAPTTVIVGSPGSGKTFFTLNQVANCLILSCRVFAIDPKNDLGVIAKVFPEVEYININDVRPGALNPFKVIKNIDTNFISSLISIICGGLSDSQIVSITPIINDFVNKFKRSGAHVSFSDVADYLYANDNTDAQTIGTKLQIHRDSKYGPLLFEEGDDSLKFDSHSKIISLHGMDLPKSQDKKLSEVQKFNSGIVYIICKILRDLLTEGGYPTLFVMDEAHIAFKNEDFMNIIDEFMVLGRSLNVATILATQNASHFPGGIAQLVSSKFCFKSSTSEAENFLNMFFNKDGSNSADFDSIIYQIGQFSTGDCFYIDSQNRSGIFHVTSLLGNDVTSNPLMRK